MTEHSKKESIFIVDWDNTLFSTDYLKKAGFHFENFFDLSSSESNDDYLIDQLIFKEISSLEEVNS